MKLSDFTIESIREFISGDNGFKPYLSGSLMLKIFNQIGYKDVYDYKNGGMPDKLSRNQYVVEKLKEINGTKGLVKLIEIIFDPRHFVKTPDKDIKIAADKFNSLIIQDGYRLNEFEGKYKVIGTDLPDDIEVEVHFEEIQSQIIEQIKTAKYSIWIAVAWFTDKDIMTELYNRSKDGLNIRLVILDDDINRQYGFKYENVFETKRVKPQGVYQNIMHHKFCIIDLRTIIHGSYNWTNKARWNKETITIENSRELAEKFASEFIELIK